MTQKLDELIDRMGTQSVKWEYIKRGSSFSQGDHADARHGDERILPMWVADMDFRCPPAVIEALEMRVAHGIFGYTKPADSYFEAVMEWMEQYYGWKIEQEWMTLAAGVVPAINTMIQGMLQPGDKVIIQPPVYYPFAMGIVNNGMEVVENALLVENGRYLIDFDDLAVKAADPAVKMAILCSPHNPVSRVWNKEELTRFGEICIENDLIIVADEIHGDLIYDGVEFVSFPTISEEFADNCIVCNAPSKTFNLAGLQTSNIIIKNEAWRKQYRQQIVKNGTHHLNIFGPIAAEAAYRHGRDWLDGVMAYVQDNYRFMESYCAEYLPQVDLIQPEGTYLVWADFSKLGLSPEARKVLMMDDAKVYLDEGEMFGVEGTGFERFNIACPRSLLEEALESIKTAVS